MAMRHLIIIFAILCASCSGYSIKPYRLDIQQGNVVTSKMLLQLKPGMTKSQVRFIMGTPLIQDTFHANRWDYFYQLRKGGKIVDQRRVIMDFENETLARVRGDVVPSGSGQLISEPVTTSDFDKQPPVDKRSLLDKLKFWKSDDKAEKTQAAPAELVKPQTSLPAASKQAAPAKEAPPPADVQPAQAEPVAPSQQALPEPALVIDKKLGDDSETKPEPQAVAPAKAEEPAPVVEPPPAKVKEPAPVAKPKPAPVAKPQTASKPAAKPAPETKPEDDLPPEEDPSFFERMLEKIGF